MNGVGGFERGAPRRLLRRAAGLLGPEVDDEVVARAVRGRLILITGASEGIGRASALRLGRSGARLIVVARTRSRLQQLREEVEASGGVAHVLPVDLSDPEAAAALADRVLSEFGCPDVVITNAGHSIKRSVADTAERPGDVDRLTGVNFLGPVQLLLRLLPAMRLRRKGLVVNVSTAPVGSPGADFSLYLATKSAFEVWLRSAAIEMRGDGVRVATVYPGLVRTRMSAPTKAYQHVPAMTADDCARVICRAVATGRSWRPWWGTSAALAATALPRTGERLQAGGARVLDVAAGAGAVAVLDLWRDPARLRSLGRGARGDSDWLATLLTAPDGDDLALLDASGEVTFADLRAESERWAGPAAAARPGERVGVSPGSARELLAMAFAVRAAGAEVVLVPADLPAGRRPDLAMLTADGVHRPSGRDPAPGRGGGGVPVSVLSSGTTGAARVVERMLSPRTLAGPLSAHLQAVPMQAGDRLLVAADVAHGFGLSYLAAGLALGMPVIDAGRRDAGQLAELWLRHRPQVVVLLPIQLRRLLGLPPEALVELAATPVRAIIAGSASLPVEVLDRAREVFGHKVFNFYGTSQAGWATMAGPGDLRAAPATVGRPMRGIAVRIRDAAGNITLPGVTGEIEIRGWAPHGAWVPSGDLGHWDRAGRLFLDGRSDDMIVSGGSNVYPQPVLEAMLSHPAVLDAVLEPVPDPEFGRRFRARVQRRPGYDLQPDQLRDWLRPRLTRAERPRDLEVVDELDRTATGKPVRRAVGG